MLVIGESMMISATIIDRKALIHNTLRQGGPARFVVKRCGITTYNKKDFFKKMCLTSR